jgi:UPF0271 protein
VARIDLNCDLGEGAGHDAALMPLITSASIACGAHAGDTATMRATAGLAAAHGVAVGAHPGYADRANFGRSVVPMTPAELTRLVAEQIAALAAVSPVPLRHVKPHGALYNLAATDRPAARAIVAAVQAIDPHLIVFALAGSELVRAAREAGLRVAQEVFADRTYRPDGTLTPRACADAMITDEVAAVAQVQRMIVDGVVRATDGTDVSIAADTLCLHGDSPHAVAFARALRTALHKADIEVMAIAS